MWRTFSTSRSDMLATRKSLKHLPMAVSTATAHLSSVRDNSEPRGPMGRCEKRLWRMAASILVRRVFTRWPPKAMTGSPATATAFAVAALARDL